MYLFLAPLEPVVSGLTPNEVVDKQPEPFRAAFLAAGLHLNYFKDTELIMGIGNGVNIFTDFVTDWLIGIVGLVV